MQELFSLKEKVQYTSIVLRGKSVVGKMETYLFHQTMPQDRQLYLNIQVEEEVFYRMVLEIS